MRTVLSILLLFAPALHASGSGLPAWLAGCWAQRAEESSYEEQWMSPAGGIMPGMSRSLKDGRPAGFEFLRIQRNEDGVLEYVALPSGQEMTVFTLAEAGPERLVFENPEHDFPQRIVYERDGDTLSARVEGSGKGFDLAMRRVSCDASASLD